MVSPRFENKYLADVTQGPCEHLQSETVHQSGEALTARRSTNGTIASRRVTPADTICPEGINCASFSSFIVAGTILLG